MRPRPQMPDARQRVQLKSTRRRAMDAWSFAASGLTIHFPGATWSLRRGQHDPDAELDNRERRLPMLEEGQALAGERFPQPPRHQPPLVKRFEIGAIAHPPTRASSVHHRTRVVQEEDRAPFHLQSLHKCQIARRPSQLATTRSPPGWRTNSTNGASDTESVRGSSVAFRTTDEKKAMRGSV